MKIKFHQNKNIKAFTLVEMLIYMGGLLLIGAILSMIIVQFYGLYNEIISVPKADREALMVIDNITKDIRSSYEIDLTQSNFGTSSGILVLNTILDNNLTSKKFYIEDGIIKFQQGNDEPINISSKNLNITNFNISFLPTPVSKSVKFSLTFEFDVGKSKETKSYTGFAILRESYE